MRRFLSWRGIAFLSDGFGSIEQFGFALERANAAAAKAKRSTQSRMI
jgi:hypothetical protein